MGETVQDIAGHGCLLRALRKERALVFSLAHPVIERSAYDPRRISLPGFGKRVI